MKAVRWLRRSARKAGAPNAAAPSPAALSDQRKTPPTAGSSSSVRIIVSGTPAAVSHASHAVLGASSPASGTDPRDPADVALAICRDFWAPPPLGGLSADTMLAVASVPGKIPEEWQEAYPLWMAWPHAAGAIYAVEMTAGQLRARLAAMAAG